MKLDAIATASRTTSHANHEPVGLVPSEVGYIPKDWGVRELSEISRRITDGDHLTPRRTNQGNYLLSARNVLDGRVDLSDVDYVDNDEYARMEKRCGAKPGDLLISCSGHGFGRIAVVPPGLECVLVRSAALVKVDHAKVDAQFVQYWLQGRNAQAQIANSASRAAQPNLFLHQIQRIHCAVPPTIGEQRAIAEALSDVDELIGALEKLIAKKRAIKFATMQQLLTGKTRLPGFSGEWETKRLGEGISLSSGHHVLAQFCNATGQGVPYLTGPADFPNGEIVLTKYTTRPGTMCEAGDILVTVKGSGAGTMIVADERYCISRQLMAITVRAWNSRLIFCSLQQNAAELHAASTGLIPGLSRSDILCQELPLPVDPEEQKQIANVLSDMDAEITALEQRRDKTKAIKQGMMQQLLTGKTRLVP
ncbi:hypothetical protein GYB59_14515 [bacterium]|nr:hypothetical protein [bacterium]